MNTHTIFVNQDSQVLRNSISDIQRKNSLLAFPPNPDPTPYNLEILVKEEEKKENPFILAKRKHIFSLFLYVVIFTNYDTGVIPAGLVQIQEELDINYTQQALLGSLPNLGISCASFFVSYLIGKFTAKRVLSAALLLNIGFCALFSLSKNLLALYFSRFCMGFTQAFWVIYGPVWTHNFSPKERQTTWLGLLQGFSPLGIIFGYLVTGFVINIWSAVYSWRLSIILQGCLEILPLLYLQSINNVDIDIVEHKKMNSNNTSTVESEEIKETFWTQTKRILKNEVFLLSSLSVCVAFFVVYGIQFWGTAYMIRTMNITPYSAMITYFLVTCTAPVGGVLFGGYLLDHMGGYKGENKLVALKMCLLFSTCCVVIAVPTGFVYNIYCFAPLLWLEIFFGASVIPPGTGLVVDSVDEEMQAFASSFSQLIYNMFGYFLSPIFSAAIMDTFDDSLKGMKWGFRLNQFITVIAVVLLSILIKLMRKNNYKDKKNTSNFKIDALLQYTGDDNFYRIDDNPIIKDLKLTLSFQTPSQLRFTLRSFTSPRYEIPEEYPYPHDEKNYSHPLPSSFLYKIELDEKNFSLKVIRKRTNEIIFDTSDLFFIFSDRYLEISSKLQTDKIFGLGERVHNFKLDFPGRYTIWNRDLPKVIDEGEGAQNTYGLHPMYLLREKEGDFHIVYLRNSNGMDIFLNNTIVKKDGKYQKIKTITYKVVGGILDFKFFLGGENVEELVQDYHKYLGGWAMQPFWSFGYHQSRWGYTDLEKINSTLSNFKESKMPLDAIWMDIDYMINHNIFTIDPDRYNLTLMKSLLQEEFKKKLILIIDPGVAVNKSDISYQRGIEKEIFIKDSNKKPLKACVWPGQTHFPDFFNPNTQEYWNEMFDMLYSNVEFDGIWLDMNELSNFVDGKVGKGECGNGEKSAKNQKVRWIMNLVEEYSKNPVELNFLEFYDSIMEILNTEMYHILPAYLKCNYSSEFYYYVYNPGDQPLDKKAVCLNAIHFTGDKEYDVHNFNGFLQGRTTNNYLASKFKDQKPFVLTRSTAPGSGKFVMHWTGDNVSKWSWLKLSISGIFSFNLYGVPNTGADICGFAENTNEELCSRWMQLGALYPFSRNHNEINAIDQDPFSFSETLKQTSFHSIKLRYSLLKYYYSLFLLRKGRGTIFRPLFFEFGKEEEVYKDEVLNQEFLIGSNLLATPILDPSTTVIEAYFPGKNELWFDLFDGTVYEGGQYHFVKNDLKAPPAVFLREGTILFRQDVTNVTSSYDLDDNFELNVVLKNFNNSKSGAVGKILAINNLNSAQKIDRCGEASCFLDIKADLQMEKNKLKLLNISFDSNEESELDAIFLKKISFYGISKVHDFKNFQMEFEGQKVTLNKNMIKKGETKNNIVSIEFDQKLSITKGIVYAFYFE